MAMLKDAQTTQDGIAFLHGSFRPNGSSAVDNDNNEGTGFTVARGGTGTFTITFSDKWTGLIAAGASLQLASADDKFVELGAFTLASKTLVINVWDVSDAAVADVASNANNKIHFWVCYNYRS